jgi:hypothetical protein
MEFSTSFAVAIVVAVCAAAAVYFVLRSRIDSLSRRTAGIHAALVAYVKDMATIGPRPTGPPPPLASAPASPHPPSWQSEYETDTDDEDDDAGSVQPEVRTVTLDNPVDAAWPPVTNRIFVVADGPLGDRAIVSEDDIMEELSSVDGGDNDNDVVVPIVALELVTGEQTLVQADDDVADDDVADDGGDGDGARQQYEAMTKTELKRLVTAGGLVSNPSRLRKLELVDALVEAASPRS